MALQSPRESGQPVESGSRRSRPGGQSHTGRPGQLPGPAVSQVWLRLHPLCTACCPFQNTPPRCGRIIGVPAPALLPSLPPPGCHCKATCQAWPCLQVVCPETRARKPKAGAWKPCHVWVQSREVTCAVCAGPPGCLGTCCRRPWPVASLICSGQLWVMRAHCHGGCSASLPGCPSRVCAAHGRGVPRTLLLLRWHFPFLCPWHHWMPKTHYCVLVADDAACGTCTRRTMLPGLSSRHVPIRACGGASM